jgi:hypothetical protein
MLGAMPPARSVLPPGPARVALLIVGVALALLPLLVHRQLISDDLFMYSYDAGQSHLARFQILGEALSAGRLPLWQTISYAGSPFLANPENPALYPPAMLAATLAPPLLAMNLTALAHLSVAAVGMALLVLSMARRCSLGAGAALAGGLLAGVLFSLNWYTRLEHLNLVTYGAAHALVPWILLALDQLLQGPRPRRAAGALALLLSAQITTGGLYVVAYTGLGLILWVLVAGLAGDALTRRRALSWGLLAAGLAGLVGISRLLPYFDWVAVTNRASPLELEFALGRTLGGHDSFDWTAVAERVGNLTAGFAGLALALPSLLLWRQRSVLAAWVFLIVGSWIALGPGYEWLHAVVPPFDRVRNALRGWTLVNAAWPLLAGLGFATCWQALRNRARSSSAAATPRTDDAGQPEPTLAPCLAAATLAAALSPWLLDAGEHSWMLEQPFSRQAVLQNYPNWTSMAEQAGDDWRAMCLNVRAAGARNEQFIAAELGLETPAGFMGYAYPVDLARHLYTNYGSLAPKQRLRRAKALSVRHATVNEFMAPRGQIWEEVRTDPFPGGVDGPLLWADDAPRPRAFLPAAVGVVFGHDPEHKVLYSLYDAPAFQAHKASLVSLDPALALPPPASVDVLVVIQGEDTAGSAWVEQVRALGTPVMSVSRSPRRNELGTLNHVAQLLAATDRLPGAGTFERNSPGAVQVDLPADVGSSVRAAQGRWLVLSETWHMWGGWDVRSGGESLSLQRADGVASAVWLPHGSTSLSASYDPEGMSLALALGALGVLAAALLLAWPYR